MSNQNKKYLGKCHCGKISFETEITPQWLVKCNCSICSRLGAKWAHTEHNKVAFNYNQDDCIKYSWGDKCLVIISCKHCGCTTHWDSLDNDEQRRVGLNFRMCSESDTSALPIRHFDGADSWEFLD